MKKNTLILLILLTTSFTVINAQYATVTVARKNNSNGLRTDLGYIIIDKGDSLQQQNMAVSKIFKEFPYLDSFEIVKSEKKHHIYQNILVIISTSIFNVNHVVQKTYGIGFGYTKETALKNSISWVRMLNPIWSLEKDGYKIEFVKDFASLNFQTQVSFLE